MKLKRSNFAIYLITLVLLIDQSLKIWVKLNMHMGEHFNVFGEGQDWFQILFTENPGMAFGIEFGGSYGKLALSLFRIIAVGFISFYLYTLIKKKKSYGLIASIALIWAGAVGNIIDSMFYGLIFSGSSHSIAIITDFGQGYAGFLHGRVVDMLYFPLIEGTYPSWMPFVGGDHFQFFQPIFNIADSSISIGVVLVIIFYRRFFKDVSKKKEEGLDNPEGTSVVTVPEPIENSFPLENTKTTVPTNNATTNLEVIEGVDIPMDDDLEDNTAEDLEQPPTE